MTKPVVHLPDELQEEIIQHCLTELPNEGCGLLGVDANRVVKVYPTRNTDESSTSYTIDPAHHFAALTDAESNGWTIGGVFHSHPKGDAEMSDVDRQRALEPDWLYVIVGLADPGPVIKIHTP